MKYLEYICLPVSKQWRCDEEGQAPNKHDEVPANSFFWHNSFTFNFGQIFLHFFGPIFSFEPIFSFGTIFSFWPIVSFGTIFLHFILAKYFYIFWGQYCLFCQYFYIFFIYILVKHHDTLGSN